MRLTILLLAIACRGDLRAEEVDPRSVQTVMVAGGGDQSIAVSMAGNTAGPGIVFIHGFLASTLHWQKQMTADLADDFHLVFIDMRGHGASAKPAQAGHYLDPRLFADDIAAAISAAELEKPVLVGWSYGGLFIMDYLRHYGMDSVSGIVLAGTTAGLLPPEPPKPDTPERRLQIESSRAANLFMLQDWTQGFVSFLTRDGTLPASEVETLRLSAMLVPHYVRRALRERPLDNTDLVESLNMPVLMISGSEDISAKPQDMGILADQLPSATLKSFAGVGPMTFWYQAERFNAELAKFVNAVRAHVR